ncbi:unnamed protein product [Cuscuta campestris]|uniref:Matrin-type domain-containing protein n=1 Tax=Cuscuta campestris TaxID=132261 RepID=A0A484KQ91_9ASTE|nr:unnamed protein product [Cuscuta campestris]
MTEYWVSQGNKWCDFCKIFLSNNPSSVRNHELGQRHKDNVAQRLNSLRQEKTAKEKEQKEAARALEQIEASMFGLLCLHSKKSCILVKRKPNEVIRRISLKPKQVVKILLFLKIGGSMTAHQATITMGTTVVTMIQNLDSTTVML